VFKFNFAFQFQIVTWEGRSKKIFWYWTVI